MASLPVRDPIADHLLTPQNAALVVIDYQPSQLREETVADIVEIVLTERLLQN
jgi:hypothetical protein